MILGLESLDKSRAVGRESLEIPKLGRESLDTDFCDPCPDFRNQISVCPDFHDPCPDFRGQILDMSLGPRLGFFVKIFSLKLINIVQTEQ